MVNIRKWIRELDREVLRESFKQTLINIGQFMLLIIVATMLIVIGLTYPLLGVIIVIIGMIVLITLLQYDYKMIYR